MRHRAAGACALSSPGHEAARQAARRARARSGRLHLRRGHAQGPRPAQRRRHERRHEGHGHEGPGHRRRGRGSALNRVPLTAESSRGFDAMEMVGRAREDAGIAGEDVRKAYGDVQAVDGVSFQVAKGEIFGLLGPNGAGKTTTMEMIEGLHAPDSGEIHVLGMDVRRFATQIKGRVGVQLQTAALYPQLTVTELLALFGTFYPASRR